MTDIKIVTLDTKVSEVVINANHKAKFNGWNNSAYNSTTKVLDMTLSEFLAQGLRVNGFGRTKYREVIRAAVFNEFIDYDAREAILEFVL